MESLGGRRHIGATRRESRKEFYMLLTGTRGAGKCFLAALLLGALAASDIFCQENAFDRMAMNSYSKNLDYAGTAATAIALLTPAILFAAPPKDYWKIGLEYAETIAFAYGAKELCKLCVDRARPYTHFPGAPLDKVDEWDDSFISGHTTLSFASASFTAFMFCKYFPDSEWKAPVIVGAYSLATATAVLRVASGSHYMTDVLCGALVGSAAGILVPWLNSLWIKPSYKKQNVQMTVSPASFTMSLKF